MNRAGLKTIFAATAFAVIAAISGCDLQENADLDNGREKFVEQCARCHYLAGAATAGDIGPDLDAAFADARSNGFDDDTIEGVVTSQIENPRETDVDDPTYMPADLVTGDDKRDVAAYVASVAGRPDIEFPEAAEGGGAQVYVEQGCGACHALAAVQASGVVGPNLDDVLPGQSREMILRSIVSPDSEISLGYEAGIMPEFYGETIDPEELEMLVDFLARTAGDEPGGSRGSRGGGGGGSGGGSG